MIQRLPTARISLHQLHQEVTVIDDDQGHSGSGTARADFEKLLVAVAAGQVGAVVSIEASRLARDGRDWHSLLDSAASSEP
jgi:DNA invertase Pin-like site-specific DNA recombinase